MEREIASMSQLLWGGMGPSDLCSFFVYMMEHASGLAPTGMSVGLAVRRAAASASAGWQKRPGALATGGEKGVS